MYNHVFVGCANTVGIIVIEPIFSCALSFENGAAKVSLNCDRIASGEYSRMVSDSWFYIDHQGKSINQNNEWNELPFDKIEEINNSNDSLVSRVCIPADFWSDNGLIYRITSTGVYDFQMGDFALNKVKRYLDENNLKDNYSKSFKFAIIDSPSYISDEILCILNDGGVLIVYLKLLLLIVIKLSELSGFTLRNNLKNKT